VWAYLGIAVKQWDATVAAWVAVACAIVVAALVALVVAGRVPPRDGLQARGTT
jgi:hypothetical protein